MLGVPPGSLAQQVAPHEPGPYAFVLLAVPLDEALDVLITQTNINLIFDPEQTSGKTTYCNTQKADLENSLRCILNGTGMDYARLSSGAYMLFPSAQTPPQFGVLSGQVLDAQSGEPLANAHVFLADARRGTATNRAGRFAFTRLKPGAYRVVVTHVGYADRVDSLWVAPDTDAGVALHLQAEPVFSAPVVINGLTRRLPSLNLHTERVDPTTFQQPTASVSPDVVTTLSGLSGLHMNDAQSTLHLQGGDAGDHQFLLDGVPVFVPIQNGGFIGPFNPFAIQQITVHKAGFGVAHGSHLSGVIALDQQVGEPEKERFVVQIDPLSIHNRINGTWHHNRDAGVETAWMAGGRFGLWKHYRPRTLESLFERWSTPDPILLTAQVEAGALDQDDVPTDTPSLNNVYIDFTDAHLATRTRFGPLRTLRTTFYRGNAQIEDEFTLQGSDEQVEDKYNWTNTLGQLRYEWVMGNRAFADVSLWLSRYSLTHPYDLSPLFPSETPEPSKRRDEYITENQEQNRLTAAGFKANGHYALSDRHTLQTGFEGQLLDSRLMLSVRPAAETPTLRTAAIDARSTQWSAYLDDQIHLSPRTTFRWGTRVTYLPTRGTLYAEPRATFRYDHEGTGWHAWAVRLTAGRYRQFINQFDVPTYNIKALLPTVRFWLPSGDGPAPSEATHLTAAVLLTPGPAWQFQWENYYKYQPHKVEINYGAGIETPLDSPADLLIAGSGFAYGTSGRVDYKTATTRAVAQYDFGVARQRLPNRFGNRTLDAPWHTPHRIRLSMHRKVGRRWSLYAGWQGLFGRQWGFRRAYYTYLEPNADTRRFASVDWSNPEAHKLPVFSQLDVSASYTHTLGPARVQLRLMVLNVLDRNNVLEKSLSFDQDMQAYAPVHRPAYPFMPSLSLNVRW